MQLPSASSGQPPERALVTTIIRDSRPLSRPEGFVCARTRVMAAHLSALNAAVCTAAAVYLWRLCMRRAILSTAESREGNPSRRPAPKSHSAAALRGTRRSASWDRIRLSATQLRRLRRTSRQVPDEPRRTTRPAARLLPIACGATPPAVWRLLCARNEPWSRLRGMVRPQSSLQPDAILQLPSCGLRCLLKSLDPSSRPGIHPCPLLRASVHLAITYTIVWLLTCPHAAPKPHIDKRTWMDAWSLEVMRRLVHEHLRGMYRSTVSPSSLRMATS